MEFEITETEKYKAFVKNKQSLIELAKVEVLQKIAEQLEMMNHHLDQLSMIVERLSIYSHRG